MELELDKTQKIYEQRAKRLAERKEGVSYSSSRVPVLVFTLMGERYGIELSKILGVFPVKRLVSIPGTPQEVLGVMSVQGDVYTVLKLSALLEFASEKTLVGLNSGHVLLLRKEGLRTGLWVERLEEIDFIESSISEKKPSGELKLGVRRQYLRSASSQALIYIEIDSIFENKIFEEN